MESEYTKYMLTDNTNYCLLYCEILYTGCIHVYKIIHLKHSEKENTIVIFRPRITYISIVKQAFFNHNWIKNKRTEKQQKCTCNIWNKFYFFFKKKSDLIHNPTVLPNLTLLPSQNIN